MPAKGVDHYQISAVTGAIAAGAAANSIIFYARNANATKLVRLLRLTLDGMYATTAFAAGAITIKANIARSFTAEDGTPGGTALTLTGHNQKLRTSMATIAAMGVVRISTTAALAAPTWDLDDAELGQIATHSSGGWNSATPIIGSIYLPHRELYVPREHEQPAILAPNEGIAIRATVPITGVWHAGITLGWGEADSY